MSKDDYQYTIEKLCEIISDCPHGLSYSDEILTKAYDVFCEDGMWDCEELCGSEENCGKGYWKCWHKFFQIVKTLEN